MKNTLVRTLNATCHDKFDALLNAVVEEESGARSGAESGDYRASLSAPMFTQEQLDTTDWCGYRDFSDAEYLRGLSVVPNIQTHYKLYGKSQGREILEKIEKTAIKNVVIIAPSYGKQCGIGEYGRYLESSFKAIGKTAHSFRTSSELLGQSDEFLKDTLVLVNHGPGLFDGFNPKLGQGESTMQLLQNLQNLQSKGALPAILMHSLIDSDQELLYSRQQMILNSAIPAITFITDASKHFYIPQVELGVSPIKKPKNTEKNLPERSARQEIIGFFGFFQYGGKDFDALFHLVRSLRGKLAGSVATSNADELNRFTEVLDESNIPHDLGSGWVSDTELAGRLLKADYFYLPQNDYDHWNNSATARFVMNLDRPVFLPPHQPFLDVEDGAVFATTEDLPRIVSHYRRDDKYAEAVKKSADFRKKADMRNTAKKLMTDVFSDFKDKSLQTIVSDNDTSIHRFLALSDERKTLYLSTKGVHTPFKLENAVSLLNDGVFSSVHKSVDPVSFWRKHYNLEDIVQNTLLESVHSVYQSVCKKQIEISEIVSIVRFKVEQMSSGSSGDLLSHTLKMALSRKGDDRRYHNPSLAIYSDSEPATEADIAPDRLNEIIKANLVNDLELAKIDKGEINFKPYINNVLEMIVQPAHVLDDRNFSIDLSEIDMHAVLSLSNIYERYNLFIELCTQASIDINSLAIVDQPVVRSVENRRLTYVIEDLFYYQDDMFILNAVRSLFKRDPFPIESLALRNMLDELGKKNVLTYLNSHRSSRGKLVDLDSSGCDVIDLDFSRFSDVMRDPISGGIESRNRYLVEIRNNYRWWLANKSCTESYLNQVSGNFQLLLSLYFHISSSDAEFTLENTIVEEAGLIENWMTVDGKFVNSEKIKDALLELTTDKELDFSSISNNDEESLVNFHNIEDGGVWTNGNSAYVIFSVEDDGVDHSSYEYSLAVQLLSYGSKLLPDRQVQVSIVSDVPGAVSTDVQYVLSDDRIQNFSLPLSDVSEAQYYTVHFYISETANPHKLEKSPDNRELGLKVQKLRVNRVENVIESATDQAA